MGARKRIVLEVFHLHPRLRFSVDFELPGAFLPDWNKPLRIETVTGNEAAGFASYSLNDAFHSAGDVKVSFFLKFAPHTVLPNGAPISRPVFAAPRATPVWYDVIFGRAPVPASGLCSPIEWIRKAFQIVTLHAVCHGNHTAKQQSCSKSSDGVGTAKHVGLGTANLRTDASIREPDVAIPAGCGHRHRAAPKAAVRSWRSKIPATPSCWKPVKAPVRVPSSPPVCLNVLPRTASE